MRNSVGKASKSTAIPEESKTITGKKKTVISGAAAAGPVKKAAEAGKPPVRPAKKAVVKVVEPPVVPSEAASGRSKGTRTAAGAARSGGKSAVEAVAASAEKPQKSSGKSLKPAPPAEKPTEAVTRVKSARTAKSARSADKGRAASAPLTPQPPELIVEPPHRQNSATAIKLFEEAMRVFNQRRFAEAKPLFEAIVARHSHEVELMARVRIYIQVCNQKTKRTDTSPRDAEEFYDRGVYALNLGDFTSARECFESALRLKPDQSHILYSLAVTCIQSEAIDDALEYLRRSIRLQPGLRAQALADSEFAGLRENRQFLAIIGIDSPFDRLDSKASLRA